MSRRTPVSAHRLRLLIGAAVILVAGVFALGTPWSNTAPPVPKPRVARVAAVSVAHKPEPAAARAPPAAEPFVVKRILPIAGPMRQGEHHWDESGAPEGQVVVTVDLAAQTISVFRAGHEIGTAVIIYGADEKPTPLGVFPITEKDIDHVSNLYHAPMPYMLRMTNDGISIHGSEVGDGYATHGCVGVPKAFARKLFAAVKLGDKVIVSRGEYLGVGDPITAA